jgi:hypothetical protein
VCWWAICCDGKSPGRRAWGEALLSLLGMVMLHELLDQFEEDIAYLKRGNPQFGPRWITWPINAFCANELAVASPATRTAYAGRR